MRLSRRLEAFGFKVEFALGPQEHSRWDDLGRDTPRLCSFTSTASLAEWLYESGWFIRNDSGVGHLASSLGVPTLANFRRRRIAEIDVTPQCCGRNNPRASANVDSPPARKTKRLSTILSRAGPTSCLCCHD
ncbi:glycosyltransferase family 9 protein [Paraburkholderia xenovorans]|uniref:glycosyltransferase family 9 protein n=1 Tax=Paraburkholderia xenovorans TaxID=36873 RepID=UPI0038B7E5F5